MSPSILTIKEEVERDIDYRKKIFAKHFASLLTSEVKKYCEVIAEDIYSADPYLWHIAYREKFDGRIVISSSIQHPDDWDLKLDLGVVPANELTLYHLENLLASNYSMSKYFFTIFHRVKPKYLAICHTLSINSYKAGMLPKILDGLIEAMYLNLTFTDMKIDEVLAGEPLVLDAQKDNNELAQEISEAISRETFGSLRMIHECSGQGAQYLWHFNYEDRFVGTIKLEPQSEKENGWILNYEFTVCLEYGEFDTCKQIFEKAKDARDFDASGLFFREYDVYGVKIVKLCFEHLFHKYEPGTLGAIIIKMVNALDACPEFFEII